MRLLNSITEELALFVSDNEIPPYAILSHTWGEEEVLFHDMLSSRAKLKKGYSEITYACEQARKDNIAWIWVDTCCIDKTSSTELSEAINSMKNSVLCYVYLSDVIDISLSERLSLQFGKSRWFTRGWTLQELLAPTHVRFYSGKWFYIGSREDLGQQITDITRIEGDFLQGRDLRLASVAKRMSWVAFRETSRTEDIAYCLLGIFDINMPLLYGEGKKAFIRLQEEIMKSTNDYSLFAWGIIDQPSGPELADPAETGVHLVAWKKESTPLKGLLANSPRSFAHSGPIVTHKPFMDSLVWMVQPPVIFDGGIRIQLPTLKEWEKRAYWWEKLSLLQSRPGCIAILGCKVSDDAEDSIGIPLLGWGHSSMGRRDNLVLVSNKVYRPLWKGQLAHRLKQIFVKPETRPELRTGDVIFGQFDCRGMAYAGCNYPSLQVEYNESERLMRPRVEPPNSRQFTSYWTKNSIDSHIRGFAIVFGKAEIEGLSFAARPLYVGFVACSAKDAKGEKRSTIFQECLLGNLDVQQTLQSPSDSVTWEYKHGLDVVEVNINSKKVNFVERGQAVSVDVIDICMMATMYQAQDHTKLYLQP